ncbi:MAG: M48 family metallopeptidase [Luteimonas sp.]|nr:M48 family metallopeptidase [Luteimonas sp.]
MPSLLRLLSPKPLSKPGGLQRDAIPFVLADGRRIDVLRVRDPRAKRLRLTVGERGARLTLPMRASMVSGDRFLHEHRDWLTEQLARMPADVAPPIRHETASLPLRDERLPLRWSEGRFARAVRDGDGVALQLPPRAGDAAIGRALRDFYEAEARADVAAWMPKYLPALPRPPSRIRLRVLSSQWGSLAPDGTLTLDLALVLGRPSAFEYVLVHELCHLIHADHSRRFWREVEARFPAWKDERDYFHAEGRRLKATLHALLG